METQQENHRNRVSNEKILEFLLEVKELAEQEKKAKAATASKPQSLQDERPWYKTSSTFTSA